eukprot:CAMPEP_0114503108 /NCGR_PEP_ID=MMETSP0109-20121206/9468_1 /TAXON_ID=29199 /ORGANISM="Chlorarachnion reptans, Strain CCCM449" /LENGTH=78 /DNA_ID=CAMNT_0001681107 /DNA_START=302 /DNA_END=535 /DNA_ORIENTATION=-
MYEAEDDQPPYFNPALAQTLLLEKACDGGALVKLGVEPEDVGDARGRRLLRFGVARPSPIRDARAVPLPLLRVGERFP